MKFITRYWPVALIGMLFGLFFFAKIVDPMPYDYIPAVDGATLEGVMKYPVKPTGQMLADSVFWFTVGFLAIIGVCLWLLWQNVKQKSVDNGLSDAVVTFTGGAGITIALCSFSLSVFYGFTMGGGHGYLPIVFAVIFGAISVAEFTSAYWLEYWLTTRNALLYVIATLLMVVGVSTSIIAGQALIAGQIDKVKQERLVASDVYKSALQARENAQTKVQKLAISESEFEQATAQFKSLNAEAQAIISQNSSYAQCSGFPLSLCTPKSNKGGVPYTTRNTKTNDALAPIRDGMLTAKKVINQYQSYQAAQDLADKLLAKPLPRGSSVELPHIKWLSAVTGMEPDLVEARLYLSLAIIAELTGLILLFFYGKGTRPHMTGLNPAKVTEVPALETGGYILQEGYAYLHGDEIVLTKEQAREWLAHMANKSHHEPQNTAQRTPAQQNIIRIEGQRVPNNLSGKTGKGRIGLIDTCVQCGNDYVVKTWNQTHCCNDCSAKSKGYENSADRWQAVKRGRKS